MKKKHLLIIAALIFLILSMVDRYFDPFVVFESDELIGRGLYYKSVSSDIKVYDWNKELEKLSYCLENSQYCIKIDVTKQKLYQFTVEYPSAKEKERLCVFINDKKICHKKSYFVDSSKFLVKAKTGLAVIDENKKLNYEQYFDISNNISGLKTIKCTEENRENYINLKCLFVSNNAFQKEASKKILVRKTNILENKKIAFLGDSITKANSDLKGFSGWAGRVGIANRMNYSNLGVSGASFTVQASRGAIVDQLKKIDKDTDYIIIQGGINDAAAGASTLEIEKALENLFIKAQEKFPDAKLGFIITYKTIFSSWGDRVRDRDADAKMMRKLCNKYSIAYLDLYDGYYMENNGSISYTELLEVEKGTYFANENPKDVHLNDKAYDLLSPIIEMWIKGL